MGSGGGGLIVSLALTNASSLELEFSPPQVSCEHLLGQVW